MEKSKCLKEIGERNIIDNIIMEKFQALKTQNDDCAVIKLSEYNLFFSTDPAPKPIAFDLGFRDYYYYGWLTVVVNLSDLASMGAEPVGILTACVMPENMSCSDYLRFLEGLSDACDLWHCPLIGGNIKDGHEFSSNGFIIGKTPAQANILRQNTAQADDVICVIGTLGLFWSSVIYFSFLKNKLPLSDVDYQLLFNSLVRPTAKIREGIEIAATGSITACTDNSDGITWSIINMAKKSGVDFVIDFDNLPIDPLVSQIASAVNIDYPNLLFTGGDYQLVCTVKENRIDRIRSIVERLGSPFHIIGHTQKGSGKALIQQGNQLYLMNDLSSERFSSGSIFSHTFKAYIEILQQQTMRGYPVCQEKP